MVRASSVGSCVSTPMWHPQVWDFTSHLTTAVSASSHAINSLSRGAGVSLSVKRHLPSARACVSSIALETIKTYNHSTWFNKVSPNPLEERRESRCFPPACGTFSLRMRIMNSRPTESSRQDEIRGPTGQKGSQQSPSATTPPATTEPVGEWKTRVRT